MIFVCSFFLSYAQNVVLTSGKKMTKLPKLGGGGVSLIRAMPERKCAFSYDVFPESLKLAAESDS